MPTAHRTTNAVCAISSCVSSVQNFESACSTPSKPATHPATCAPHSRSQNLAPPRTSTIFARSSSGAISDASARAAGTMGGTPPRGAIMPVTVAIWWVIQFSIRARQVGPRWGKWLTTEEEENDEGVARVHFCPRDVLGGDVCAENVHCRCSH